MTPPFVRRAAVLAGLLAAAGRPAGAHGQHASAAGAPQTGTQAAVARLVNTFRGQLRRVAEASPAPERAAQRPAPLTACTSLYALNVRKIAEGPELAESYQSWIDASYRVIHDTGGLPLPICFRHGSAVLETNMQRYLLHVNTRFIERRYRVAPASEVERRYYNGYLLVGHTDPGEADLALARLRAQGLKAQLPGPECRYLVSAEPAPEDVYHRKVFYAYRPAVPGCPRLEN